MLLDKRKKTELKCNPGLAIIDLRTEFRDPSFDLAPVVQKVDKAIHQINLYLTDRCSVILFLWVTISPVDSSIQHLKNWGLYLPNHLTAGTLPSTL